MDTVTPDHVRGINYPDMLPPAANTYVLLKGNDPDIYKFLQQALYEEEVPYNEWEVIGDLAFRIAYLHNIGFDSFLTGDDAEIKTALKVYKRHAKLLPKDEDED